MQLFGVQTTALEAASGKLGFGYLLEQGLGKTGLVLAEFADLLTAESVSRMVVLAPNSFKQGWAEEILKWGLDFDVHVFSPNSGAERWMNKVASKPRVLIINYESIRMGGTKKAPLISKGIKLVEKFIEGSARGTMIVADESIQLKGHDSNQTKGAIHLAKQCKYRRILTGKPIVQGPHDLWGQMRFIGNLDGFNYYSFRNAFCKMGGWKAKQIVGAQNEDILEERIKDWVFRATKADWTDLPPKLYTVREYNLSGEMASMYRSMEEEFVMWLESGDEVTVDAAITKYIKLAQIQAGFIIDEDRKTHELVDPASNPRIVLLKSLIQDEVTGKVTIPYRHRYVRDMLLGQLADLQPACIGGGMSPQEIEDEKRKFNEIDSCRVILLQMSAAKYGHTLLGGPEPDNRCATSIIFENSYSGDDRSQIDDRIHRHGQKSECVTYIDLVGTKLDRAMIAAQQRKDNIFQTVFKNIRSLR